MLVDIFGAASMVLSLTGSAFLNFKEGMRFTAIVMFQICNITSIVYAVMIDAPWFVLSEIKLNENESQ